MTNPKKKKRKMIIQKRTIIITVLTLILLTILIFLARHFLLDFLQKRSFEKSLSSFTDKNQATIFSIDQITFFSNSDAKNKNSSQTNFTIQNLFTYTDMAFFINRHSDENSTENIIKELSIQNFKQISAPTLGSSLVYYKNLNNFAKSELLDSHSIENGLSFNITGEDTADFNSPILFNNGANPITLSYINQNIKTDYTITDTTTPITYNGTLLKRCGITLEQINTEFSFDVYLTNHRNEKFKTTIFITIPYEEIEKTIYEGTITVKKEVSFPFYRYE